jgi:hypothetical protein
LIDKSGNKKSSFNCVERALALVESCDISHDCAIFTFVNFPVRF